MGIVGRGYLDLPAIHTYVYSFVGQQILLEVGGTAFDGSNRTSHACTCGLWQRPRRIYIQKSPKVSKNHSSDSHDMIFGGFL